MVHWCLMLRQGLVVSVSSGSVVNGCFVMHCSRMVNRGLMGRLMSRNAMVHWSCMMRSCKRLVMRSNKSLMVRLRRDSLGMMGSGCLVVRASPVVRDRIGHVERLVAGSDSVVHGHDDWLV